MKRMNPSEPLEGLAPNQRCVALWKAHCLLGPDRGSHQLAIAPHARRFPARRNRSAVGEGIRKRLVGVDRKAQVEQRATRRTFGLEAQLRNFRIACGTAEHGHQTSRSTGGALVDGTMRAPSSSMCVTRQS